MSARGLAGLLLGMALLSGCAPAEGPEPVALDRVACARCRMLVGELRFAAQLRLASGEVLHFDDPGCLLLHRDGSEREAWLHHSSEERWLGLAEAAFREVRPTPMGYGLGAVAAGSAGALTPEQALDRVRALETARVASGQREVSP